MQIQLCNCFWLLVPLLVWNMLFAGTLPQKGFHNDGIVPIWIVGAEHILRVLVFFTPLLFALEVKEARARVGVVAFVIGSVIYSLSWLPLMLAPESAWSQSVVGVLSPAITPIVWLMGIALIGNSWLYAISSILFVVIHVLHNIIAFEFLKW